jgi:tetratricopeptide (TPR) repeat protein
MLARSNANKVADVYLTSQLAGEPRARVENHLAKARFFDPFNGQYPYQQARLQGLLEGDPAALPDITLAARRQPMEGSYLQWLGILELNNDRATGIELVLEGYRRALNKDKLALPTVDLLLRYERRQEGMDLLAERLLFGDANIDRAAPLFELYDFSRAEIGELLPASPASWVRYANYLERNGRVAEAGFFREQALAQLENEDEIQPAWFAQLINYYTRIKQPQKAIRVLRQATDAVEYAPFHVQLGDYYRAEQIWYRAAQEYKRALVLDPGNQSYLQRLKLLEQKPTSPP